MLDLVNWAHYFLDNCVPSQMDSLLLVNSAVRPLLLLAYPPAARPLLAVRSPAACPTAATKSTDHEK